ncbi:MAG: hypothetical protein GWM98_16010, partial [Nitrospinaceae bacterium]|nr:hypothetical protein [Nitrospinaceae bacterium]
VYQSPGPISGPGLFQWISHFSFIFQWIDESLQYYLAAEAGRGSEEVLNRVGKSLFSIGFSQFLSNQVTDFVRFLDFFVILEGMGARGKFLNN